MRTGHNLTMPGNTAAYGIDLTWAGLPRCAPGNARWPGLGGPASLAGRFDLVTSFDVIYSLPDEVERDAIGEMFRVLRPGTADPERRRARMLRAAITGLSGEVRRYSKRGLRAGWKPRVSAYTHSTYTNLSILPMVAACETETTPEAGTTSSRRTRSPKRHADQRAVGPLAIEAAALRVVNMPIGAYCWRSRGSLAQSPTSQSQHRWT
jgi:hypothetical protein